MVIWVLVLWPPEDMCNRLRAIVAILTVRRGGVLLMQIRRHLEIITSHDVPCRKLTELDNRIARLET